MSRTAHKLLAASGGEDAYEIEQSILCSSGDSSKLRRTPSSAGNRRTFTFSTWCKRSKLGLSAGGSNFHFLMGAFVSAGGSTDDSHYFAFGFFHTDELAVGGWATNWRITNRLFRDTAAWMHLVLQVDTTQGTAANRIKIYVNGVEETSFGTNNNPSQNYDLAINNTVQHAISDTAYDAGTGPYHFDGYMAETHFFDGAVVAPSEFGETDSDTGQWIPKKYVGSSSYGTNGYYMPWKKNDRYSPYFNANSSSGILTANHADFNVGSGNFTMECWFYVNEYAGNYRRVFGKSSSSGANADTEYQVDINASNQPVSYVYDAADNGATYLTLQSSTAITDNKWHHVALVRNGTAFNLYLDGTSVANATSSMTVNNDTHQFGIGRVGEYTGQIFNGWISNFRYVKGTAVYTSNFTPPTSPLTAITNTKLLCCQDANITTENSGTSKTLTVTAAQVKTEQMSPFTYDWYQDQSGQDNHWQADNLTVNDVMLDSPTNNFAIMNPLVVTGADGITFKQGGLVPVSGGAFAKTISTFAPSSGKWYCEYYVVATTSNFGGVGATTLNDMSQSHIGYSTGETHWVINHSTGTSQTVYKDNVATGASSLGNVSVGDIIGLSLDADNGKIYFRKNNSVIGTSTGYDITDTGTGNYWFVGYLRSQGAYGYGTFNFGQNGSFLGSVTSQGNADGNGIGDFYYSPPSGYLALCSKNLSTPAVKKSTEHFNTVLYTGDETARSITGVGFEPSWVWIKERSAGGSHRIFDQVRGVNKVLQSDQNREELDRTEVTAFNSDGFSLADSVTVNQDGVTHVAWNWKANGSGSSNTDGSINTTATSVNTTAGFSISNYQGTGSNATVGHGLGVAPSVIIIKNRSQADDWAVYSRGDATDYLELNTNSYSPLASTDDNTYWNDTAPTSSVFTIGTAHSVNASSETYVAYCFANVEGFFKSGTYRGNGESENGPYVYTGFSPALVIVKEASSAGGSWFMWDNKREVVNVKDAVVWADYSNAETSHATYEIDLLSNGFKLRGDNGGTNQNGETMLYMAWAESPFKYARAR